MVSLNDDIDYHDLCPTSVTFSWQAIRESYINHNSFAGKPPYEMLSYIRVFNSYTVPGIYTQKDGNSLQRNYVIHLLYDQHWSTLSIYCSCFNLLFNRVFYKCFEQLVLLCNIVLRWPYYIYQITFSLNFGDLLHNKVLGFSFKVSSGLLHT